MKSRPMAHAAAIIAGCFLLIAGSLSTRAADVKRTPDGDLKTVQALEARLAAAFVKKDLAFLDSAIAADAIHIGSDGVRMDKGKYLVTVTKGRMYSAYLNRTMAARAYGDVVVVNGPERVSGVFDGWKGSVDFVTTRVWALRGGRWQIVLWQATSSKPPPSETNHPLQKWLHGN
ncbi:MAG: nuclear transport factor 2 family protein [Pseudomonadota bacterium]